MYSRYCDERNWKVDVNTITEGTVGGYKEIVFAVSGKDYFLITSHRTLGYGIHI
ncbi:MAG: PCRF domain-containing protein, partial [Polyangia bacterium]